MATFTELAAALTTKGSRLDMEVVALGEDQFRVRITPNLGECPTNASAEEIQLRNLLGVPLTLSGTAPDLDEALHARLTERLEVQEQGLSAMDTLRENMSKAAEAAKKAKPKNSAPSGKATAAKPSTQEKPAEAPTEDDKVHRTDTQAPSINDF